MEDNTFQSVTTLLPPHDVDIKSRFGIRILQCDHLAIGNTSLLSGENKFINLWTGIYIEARPMSVQGNTASSIQLNNNVFEQIQGNSWGINMNTDSKGWAVYAMANALLKSNMQLQVYADPVSLSTHFNQCDKGILLRGVSGEVRYQHMDKTVVGVSAIECAGKSYKVWGNRILNTELGISKVGDENSSGFQCFNNTISLNNPLPPASLNLTAPAVPTAILSTYSSSSHVGRSLIYANPDITIPLPDMGIGISLSTGVKDFIETNHIHLTATTGLSSIAIPQLAGIFCNNNQSLTMSYNLVDNNHAINGNTVYVPGNNAGIYLNFNPNSLLRCNSSNYTGYGVFAAGQSGSSSDYARTVGNNMNGLLADYMFFPLMTDGSLGQIGMFDLPSNTKYDANNNFLGQGIFNKVFRFTPSCITPSYIDHIVTTTSKLTQAQSTATTSPPNNCRVEVPIISQQFTTTFECSSPYQSMTPIEDIDIELANEVANNQIIYEDFDEGARRAYEEMIYAWLGQHDSIRLNSPLLDSFYLNRYTQIVGNLNRVDHEIALLSDSSLMADSLAWHTQWQLATQYNAMLGTQQVFEANAQWINHLYLLSLKEGMDAIIEEIEGIEQLAYTCPYLGGNAVFRARILFGMLNSGIHYDDLTLCNSQGVYKNGISKLQNMLNQLEQAKKQVNIRAKGLSIFPNPATTSLNIEYTLEEDEVAYLDIYDMLGNKLREVLLFGNTLRRNIYIGNLASGVYVYRESYFGKRIIE
jgi:hypothetical protein